MRHRATVPRRGLTITQTARLQPGSYSFPVGEDEPAIIVRARDVTIDCSGVVLRGVERDRVHHRGVGLRVLSSERVVIRGLATVGFQVGVHVIHSQDVVLEGVCATETRCGGPLSEAAPFDLYDKAAWRQYGSGIWFERCQGGKVVSCQAGGGQNGITLDKADGVLLLSNDCSGNVGWGIHLDRACRCRLISNKCADCGHAGGDWPGAGIAVNNGCHHNQILSNDLARSAQGLLLTAVRNEQSNDNFIAYNDASHSRLSGFTVAYCDRNVVRCNVGSHASTGFHIERCRHTVLEENVAESNSEAGIAVICGEQTEIHRNAVNGNAAGIVLGPAGAYPPPSGCRICGNVMHGNGVSLRLDAGVGVVLRDNRITGPGEAILQAPACSLSVEG